MVNVRLRVAFLSWGVHSVLSLPSILTFVTLPLELLPLTGSEHVLK